MLLAQHSPRSFRIGGAPGSAPRPFRCCSSLTPFRSAHALRSFPPAVICRVLRFTRLSASAWIFSSIHRAPPPNSEFFFRPPSVECAVPPSRLSEHLTNPRRHRPSVAMFLRSPRASESPSVVEMRTDRARFRQQQGGGKKEKETATAAVGPGVRISSVWRWSPAAPRTPAAMPRISTQRPCSRSNRVRASFGMPPSIVRRDCPGGAGDASDSIPDLPAAWTLASMAARNLGTDTRPVR